MSSGMRLTQQEVDPIGGVAAAPLVIMGSALALAVAAGVTAAQWEYVGSPLIAMLGLALVAAAGVVASVSAMPSRAPFTADRLWVMVSLAVGAAMIVASTLTILKPRSAIRRATSPRSILLSASRKRGSVSGKCRPMSPMPAAPSNASQMA